MDLLLEAYGEVSHRCDMCKKEAPKYKCPACSQQTCSVACVIAHKKKSACTGTRSKAHYIDMKHYSEHNFWSDVFFLEDIGRHTDNAMRDNRKWPSSVPQTKISAKCKMLLKQARQRHIRWLRMSKGMTRAELNRTFYDSK
jgi:hypothetical protein